jgi:hypothetical protein
MTLSGMAFPRDVHPAGLSGIGGQSLLLLHANTALVTRATAERT